MGDEFLHTIGRTDGQREIYDEDFAIFCILEFFGIQFASLYLGPDVFST